MNTSALFAVTAAIAVLAGVASAGAGTDIHGPDVSPIVHHPRGTKTLYNQNSNPTGVTIPSQNYTSSAYDSAGADDFVVPSGHTWKIEEVDITGLYFNGSSGVSSEDVTFYKDRNGQPGNAVRRATYTNLKGTDKDGSFAISLGRKAKLAPGTYWVSVVVNGSGQFEWGWETNRTIHGNEAEWENPGGGLSVCPTWGTIGSCLGTTGDLMFDLKGMD